MIESIIKRNGELEPFSPEKVNGWGQWASRKLGASVDWGSVVIDAVNKCSKVCSSLDLQKALIEVCLSRKTWEYNLMAGRLYASLIDREVFNSSIPTIKEVHQSLIDANIMVQLAYSDEEYAALEKVIDHSINYTYPHYQLNQIRYKYSLRNKVAKKEYESAQFVYMRMAMALAEYEKTDRLYHVQQFYEHFAHGRINVPTPYYVNLGTRLKGYASCCLYTTDDTAKSLATGDHIGYMMTCASAGIGTHIKTRSLGDPVRGGVIQHQGKLPYYRAMVGAIGANLQNGRGGASTVHYTAFDPEVEVIQKLRHPTTPQSKRIAGCHYSFGSNRTFGRMVAKNEEYAPFSYYDQPELYEAQYLKDTTVFDKLYTEYAKTAKVKFNARDIAMGALTQAYDTGVQYLHFTDAMNKHTPFKEKIYQSNLCFSGETMVAVADGRNAVSIEQLTKESNGTVKFPVYSARWSNVKKRWVTEIKNAIAFRSGTKKVIEVVLSDGSTFRCTPDHRLALVDGTYEEAQKCIGKSVKPFFTSLGQTRKYRHINSTSNGYSKQHLMIWKYHNGEIPVNHHIDHINNVADDSIQNLQIMHRDDHFVKTAAEFSGSNNAVFKIRDGDANRNNLIRKSTMQNNPRYKGLTNLEIYNYAKMLHEQGETISFKNLIAMDDRFPKSFSKNRFGGSIKNLITMVQNGILPDDVSIPAYVVPNIPAAFRVDELIVVDIIDINIECDVYDLTVDDNHNFYIITKSIDDKSIECSGLLVHNCQEIDLITKPFSSIEELYKTIYEEGDGEIGLCNLAGAVVSNITSDKQYSSVAYYCLKMVEYTLDHAEYPFPNLRNTAQARRSAGVGIMGLAHWMAKNNHKYDTLDGRNAIHELFETHMYHLITASLKLAKELGTAEWMHKTLWPDGWLPIDTYEKNVDQLVTIGNKRDWESLRKEIITTGGIRHSVLSAMMPGESSSLGSGTTNGAYPIRELYIMKTNDTQVNHWAAPEGTKLKNKYQSAWTISTSDMIKAYAVMQKWTDQGISADLYVNMKGTDKISSTQILQDYLDMLKYGMKSRYYINSNTASGVSLNTSDDADEEINNEQEICESCSL